MVFLETQLRQYSEKYRHEKAPLEMIKFMNEEDCFSKDNTKGHFTGSAWITSPDKEKILLNHHKKLDKWIQFGGHADDEENLLDVAIREMKEETGIEEYSLATTDIFDVDIHYIPKNKSSYGHYHFDVRYLIEVDPEDTKIIISSESIDIIWVPIENVVDYNSEESINRMVKKTYMI